VAVGGALVAEDPGPAAALEANDADGDKEDRAAGRASPEHALAANASRPAPAIARLLRTERSSHGYRRCVPSRSATCVWKTTPGLIVALDERFGEPTDAYVNGSQTWLRDNGPGDITIEWRLHPVPSYSRPADLDTYEVFSAVALALGIGSEPPAPVESLWDGLEAFAAHDEEVEPAPLVAAVVEALGIEPDAAGLVDHAAIGDAWERSRGRMSIVDALLDELNP
jgi:hypothetical protein